MLLSGFMQDHIHSHDHAFTGLNARVREGLVMQNRRGMLKASLAGMAGLSLPQLMRVRAEAAQSGQPVGSGKSVILLWMAGGPSHIDTWDPKPDRPFINRGPFGVTQTAQPGVIICEHLPKQAAMLDKFTVIRSVEPRKSSHVPHMVFQTGNREAAPRTNPKGHLYPAIGSVVAKMHGPNHPSMPPYAAFMRSRSHLAFAGYLGKQYDPFIANHATRLPVYTKVGVDTGRVSGADLLRIPTGLNANRLTTRQSLVQQFDRLRKDLDQSGSMDALESYQQKAVDMVLGQRAQRALDVRKEPASVRERYGKHLWCQQALLARRLIQAGVSFITLDLSYHTASGTWDTHGDNIPPYGGISKGLGPLLPLFDHLVTTLVSDLDDHGLLDDCLVIAMGEFGRTPTWGPKGAPTGGTTTPPSAV